MDRSPLSPPPASCASGRSRSDRSRPGTGPAGGDARGAPPARTNDDPARRADAPHGREAERRAQSPTGPPGARPPPAGGPDERAAPPRRRAVPIDAGRGAADGAGG